MAITFRLSPDLKARADRYAARLGLSLNGLVAVALADYLQARDRVSAPVAEKPGKGSGPVLSAQGIRAAEVAAHNLEVERRKLEKARRKGKL